MEPVEVLSQQLDFFGRLITPVPSNPFRLFSEYRVHAAIGITQVINLHLLKDLFQYKWKNSCSLLDNIFIGMVELLA